MNTLGTLGLLVAFILGVILLFFGKRLRRIGYVVTGGAVAVLAFLVTPEAWEYSFDVNGRLIHKYHWQSP